MTATNAPIKKIALHAMRSAVSIFEFRSQFALTSVLRVDGCIALEMGQSPASGASRYFFLFTAWGPFASQQA